MARLDRSRPRSGRSLEGGWAVGRLDLGVDRVGSTGQGSGIPAASGGADGSSQRSQRRGRCANGNRPGRASIWRQDRPLCRTSNRQGWKWFGHGAFQASGVVRLGGGWCRNRRAFCSRVPARRARPRGDDGSRPWSDGRAWVESWAYRARSDRNPNESGDCTLYSCYRCREPAGPPADSPETSRTLRDIRSMTAVTRAFSRRMAGNVDRFEEGESLHGRMRSGDDRRPSSAADGAGNVDEVRARGRACMAECGAATTVTRALEGGEPAWPNAERRHRHPRLQRPDGAGNRRPGTRKGESLHGLPSS